MDLLAVDPVLARTFGAVISVVFLNAAWQKLRDLDGFEAALANYAILPEATVPLAARLLPTLEACAAIALLLEWSRGVGAVSVLGLLTVMTAAVVTNLLRGRREIDCGCGGADSHQPLSWGLVGRNALLALTVMIGAQNGMMRELYWMDYLTVACGTVALFGVYVSVNQLLANQPRLLKLRN
jgi:hypothetical protein